MCHVSAKKSRFGQKKLVCHGRESRPFRLSPGPGGRSRPRLQAQALKLRVTESQALSLYLSLSLSRGSLPESPRLSPSHQTHHRDRHGDHSVTRTCLNSGPGPGLPRPARPAPRPLAASLITIVMVHGKLMLWAFWMIY